MRNVLASLLVAVCLPWAISPGPQHLTNRWAVKLIPVDIVDFERARSQHCPLNEFVFLKSCLDMSEEVSRNLDGVEPEPGKHYIVVVILRVEKINLLPKSTSS